MAEGVANQCSGVTWILEQITGLEETEPAVHEQMQDKINLSSERSGRTDSTLAIN